MGRNLSRQAETESATAFAAEVRPAPKAVQLWRTVEQPRATAQACDEAFDVTRMWPSEPSMSLLAGAKRRVSLMSEHQDMWEYLKPLGRIERDLTRLRREARGGEPDENQIHCVAILLPQCILWHQ